MTNIKKIGLAALAAVLALPIGVAATRLSASAQTSVHSTAPAAAHTAAKVSDGDGETADDPADRDNVKAGPGNTGDGDGETQDDK